MKKAKEKFITFLLTVLVFIILFIIAIGSGYLVASNDIEKQEEYLELVEKKIEKKLNVEGGN